MGGGMDFLTAHCDHALDPWFDGADGYDPCFLGGVLLHQAKPHVGEEVGK